MPMVDDAEQINQLKQL